MKQKVSLVLSGGGARGMAHIGVIEELEKRGYEIVSLAGTSMGALVGGVYTVGKLEDLKNWLYTLDKRKVFSLIDFTFSKQGFIKGDKVFHKMKDFVPDINIEDLRIPYLAVASDILRKKEVVFTSGPLLDAIRASVSIPTVLTPVNTDKGLLVDGGILNNIPINHVKRVKGDIVIAVNVNADVPVYRPKISKKEEAHKLSVYQKKLNEFYSYLHHINPLSHEEKFGYFDIINKTLSLMTARVVQLMLESHSPDILINISHESCGTYDFFKAEELVEIGRHNAIKSLKDYRAGVK